MRVGILSDPHLGFSRYSKVNASGTNTREADLYQAYITAVENLLNADVDAIVSLGDDADVPHPKKRALHCLIQTINAAGLPYYAVGGNHTLVRVSGDIPLYTLLEAYCPRFQGYLKPTYVDELGALLVPYGNSDEIKAGLALVDEYNPQWIGGHWATDDVLPDGHDIRRSELPDVTTLLGHFHQRSINVRLIPGSVPLASTGWDGPVYIGATERKAWGEWANPTGVAVYDTDNGGLTFIDHPVRDWIDLEAQASHAIDYVRDEIAHRTDQPIVRLTIHGTPEEYAALDLNELRRIAAPALDLSIRRVSEDTTDEPIAIESFSLADSWKRHVASASLPSRVERGDVERIGIDALSVAGVAA